MKCEPDAAVGSSANFSKVGSALTELERVKEKRKVLKKRKPDRWVVGAALRE